MKEFDSSKVCVLGYDDKPGLPILDIESAYPKLYRSLRTLFESDFGSPVIYFCARCTQVTNSLLPVDVFMVITPSCLYRASKEGVLNKCIPLDDIKEIIQSNDFWVGLKIPAHHDILVKPISPKDSRDFTEVIVNLKAAKPPRVPISVRTIQSNEVHIKTLLDIKKPKGYKTVLKKVEVRNFSEELEAPSSPFFSPEEERERSMSRLHFDVKKRASLLFKDNPREDSFSPTEEDLTSTSCQDSIEEIEPSSTTTTTSSPAPLQRFFNAIDIEDMGVVSAKDLFNAYRSPLPPGVVPPPRNTDEYFQSILKKIGVAFETGVTYKILQRIVKEFAAPLHVSIFSETPQKSPRKGKSVFEEELSKKLEELQQEIKEVRSHSLSPNDSSNDALSKKVDRLEKELKEARSNSTKSDATFASATECSSPTPVMYSPVSSPVAPIPVHGSGYVYISSPLLKRAGSFPSSPRQREHHSFHTALVLTENFTEQKNVVSGCRSKGIMAQACVTMADALPLLHTAHLLFISVTQMASSSVIATLGSLRNKPNRPLVVCLTPGGVVSDKVRSISDRTVSPAGIPSFIDELRRSG
eukprot:TRINITY_DN21615_c0_g1_i1.p1 TRINITY_DN21615_c0_g1~~TRINITY_DN21615_c0_g1_i1.p1  ORF type:complete len:582 (+),score=92.71 TRINITY_DN21615_c0_g1_i1:34-1779(+)